MKILFVGNSYTYFNDMPKFLEGLANANGHPTKVSPVGRAFTRVYRAHPELELYAKDLFHPSYIGSCLAALTHYETLFGEKPRDLSALDLPAETLEILM